MVETGSGWQTDPSAEAAAAAASGRPRERPEMLREAEVLAVVDGELDERRAVDLERAAEGGVGVRRRRRPERGHAERPRVVDEVRVPELDAERAPELVALLPVDEPVP